MRHIPVHHTALNEGDLTALLGNSARTWPELGVPTAGTDAMLRTLTDFTAALAHHGVTHYQDITPEHLSDHLDQATTDPARQLRRNTLTALSLTAQEYGHDPLAVPTITPAKVHPCATHDEILILRLAAHHGDTSRCKGLAAAVLAVYSSGAAGAEAPHITLQDATDTHLHLPGTEADKPGNAITARTNPLDSWAAEAIARYRDEGFGGSDRSPFYAGYQPLDSISARNSTAAHLNKLIAVCGLGPARLTPAKIRRWSAVRHAHDTATFLQAAEYYGTSWEVLRRHLR